MVQEAVDIPGSAVRLMYHSSRAKGYYSTIQLQLTRQEFAAALELISTSRDILGNETANIECLKHLPAQLDELTLVIEKMLLADFESIISSEFDREVELVKLSECDEEVVRDTKYDECMLSAIISGLVRQQRFKFLEYFEQQAISCLKNVIKDAVLSVLDVTSETTLTNLVAEYAGVASSEDWSNRILGAVIDEESKSETYPPFGRAPAPL